MMEAGINEELEKLVREKGNMTIAALTLNEFRIFLDSYSNENSPAVGTGEPKKKLLSQQELCKELNISRSNLYKLRVKGIVPEYKAGSKAMFDADEVREAIRLKGATPSFYS